MTMEQMKRIPMTNEKINKEIGKPVLDMGSLFNMFDSIGSLENPENLDDYHIEQRASYIVVYKALVNYFYVYNFSLKEWTSRFVTAYRSPEFQIFLSKYSEFHQTVIIAIMDKTLEYLYNLIEAERIEHDTPYQIR